MNAGKHRLNLLRQNFTDSYRCLHRCRQRGAADTTVSASAFMLPCGKKVRGKAGRAAAGGRGTDCFNYMLLLHPAAPPTVSVRSGKYFNWTTITPTAAGCW